jgi:hypothetical protein
MNFHGPENRVLVGKGADGANPGRDADVFLGRPADGQLFDEPGAFVDDEFHLGDDMAVDGGGDTAVPFNAGQMVDADRFHLFSFLSCPKKSAILVPE